VFPSPPFSFSSFSPLSFQLRDALVAPLPLPSWGEGRGGEGRGRGSRFSPILKVAIAGGHLRLCLPIMNACCPRFRKMRQLPETIAPEKLKRRAYRPAGGRNGGISREAAQRVSIFIKAERCSTHVKSLKTRLIPLLISSRSSLLLLLLLSPARKLYLSSVRSRTFPDAGGYRFRIGGRPGVEGKPLPGIGRKKISPSEHARIDRCIYLPRRVRRH